MRFWFPYPLLSLLLLLFWLIISQSLSPGHILLGSVLGIALAWVTVNLHPRRSTLKNLRRVPVLAGRVAADIVRSNIAVAGVILHSRKNPVRSSFVEITLSLRDENALAVLACILTAAPGTAWVEFDRRTGILLLHVLDLSRGVDWQALIQSRYEGPLKEIFE